MFDKSSQTSFLTSRKCQGMKSRVQITAAKTLGKSMTANFYKIFEKVSVWVSLILSAGSIGTNSGDNVCKYR